MAYNTPDPDTGWSTGTPNWQIGSVLRAYPLMIFLGVLLSFISVAYFWRRQKYSWENLQILVIIIIPSSIFSSRLWVVIAEGLSIKELFTFAGLSIHGGVLGALLTATPYVWFKRHSLDMRTVYGIILPNVILGQAIGRWGNFANHEVYGRIVENGASLDWMGWMKSHMLIDGNYRQPLFFYEFMTSVGGYIFMVLIMLRKNWLRPGSTASLYLLWYGIARISLQGFRENEASGIWHPLTFAIAGLSIAAGALSILYFEIIERVLIKKNIIKEKYNLIKPIKSRREFLTFKKVDTKLKYVFFGEKIENRQNIWIVDDSEEKWSKREINQGKKNKKKSFDFKKIFKKHKK